MHLFEPTITLLCSIAAFYTFTGITHFTSPKFYLKITPHCVPAPKFMLAFTGIAEILMAIGLLFQKTQVFSAWTMIIFLVAIFPANILQMKQWSCKLKIPMWIIWVLRFPVQIVAIYLAWLFT